LPNRIYYVYLLASRSRVLYTGVTNNLERRVHEHKHGELDGFTKTYRVWRLVFFERYDNPRAAIAREKQIKRWRRDKKIMLIELANPTWEDLSAGWEGSESEQQIPRLRSG
jgi:putative endonuclease